MSIESRVEALAHLLAALLSEAEKAGVNIDAVKGRTMSTLLGSDGPGDPQHKSIACDQVHRIFSLT